MLRAAAFNAAAFIVPAMRSLTWPKDDLPAGSGEKLVGEPDVATIRRITSAYRVLDNQYGGEHIRDSMVRFLHGDVAAMMKGRFDPRTGAALLSAAAEATRLTAWASYDAGLNGLAQRYLVQALRLAVKSGDQPLSAEILAAMSHQSLYLKASAEAIDLARAAGQVAARAGVTAIKAEAAVLEAQGHAVAGDEAACARALDRAEHILDLADRSCDPQWIGYLDESYLAAQFGHCFAALNRGDLAQRFATRSLDMDGRHYARGRQFNLVLLAVSHSQVQEPEEAASVGLQALEATEGLASQRGRDYLADLTARLSPHVGLPVVRDFLDRSRPLLQPALRSGE